MAYSSTSDDDAGKMCIDISTCFGASQTTILSLGGNLYYRFNRDWFAMASLFLNRTSITEVQMAMTTQDPTVTGISGFFRIAYRF